MWKPTGDWKTARHGGSGALEVEKVLPAGEPRQFGFAKRDGMRNEFLASALAELVGAPVPKNELDNVEGHKDLFSISHAHGKESVDITLMRAHAPDNFNSAEAQEALRQASRLAPLYAWTATTDFKDDHVVIAPQPDGSYRAAGVDFQHSFGWGATDGGPVENLGLPQCLGAALDKNVVAESLATIEATTDQQIRDTVNAMPDIVANDAEKKRLSEGLIGRRDNTKLREAMTRKGWLP